MTDSLRLLATVAHLQATDSGKNLEDIANQQKEKIGEKSKLRDVQKYYDKIIADDKVTFDELENLHRLRSELGAQGIQGGTEEAFWNENNTTTGFDEHATGQDIWKVDDSLGSGNSRFYMSLSNTAEDQGAALAKQGMEAIKSELDGGMDALNDDQQLLQFEIQMATSEMQNAESTRSQSEKRMEDQRKELRRNWAP